MTQHHHALLSGELAFQDQRSFPMFLYLTIALHDWGWRNADNTPLWDEEHGEPFGFQDYPLPLRRAIYASAIAELSLLEPRAGYLLSLHYSAFLGPHAPNFEEEEKERREHLKRTIPSFAPHELERGFRFLKFYDNLSLYLCLTYPGTLKRTRPSWLVPELLKDPDTGVSYELRFLEPGLAELSPYPFRTSPLSFSIPYRQVPLGVKNAEEFRRLWEKAGYEFLPLTLKAGGS